MCGISGFIDTSRNRSADELVATVSAMADALLHRGPDSGGTWVSEESGLALGHRRLSIVDLSPEGHQPMASHSGRYWMVFNGEIYNFRAVRRELEQHPSCPQFRGHSDTEILLSAFEAWGVEATLERAVGMFAFALWDRQEQVLTLGRDRLGEKPLYYGWQGNVFMFASELKALRRHPAWLGALNRDAIALLLRHNYIPTPYSVHEAIHKLTPGTLLRLPLATSPGTIPTPVPYWSAQKVAEEGTRTPFSGSDSEAVEAFDALLRDVISQQMVADVPLGAFLSGGVDSSTIVALMQTLSSRPVKTFSIGFTEAGYNEAGYAKAVAQHLGTVHTELYVTPHDLQQVIPKLAQIYDEPFSDSSQIPTYLVAQLARQHVTVSLSGDAGDELLTGYSRYFQSQARWDRFSLIPPRLHTVMARSLRALPPAAWDQFLSPVRPFFPTRFRHFLSGDKFHKLAEFFNDPTPENMYQRIVSHWDDPAAVVIGAQEPPTALTDRARWADVPEFIQRMMFLDTVSYLPDDILVKVDRASMAASLESRVPFLDHRVVEFAWRLPLHLKVRDGQGKWLLRQVLYQYVPKSLIERPKQGFAVPLGDWLRGPLRDWADDLLDENRLRNQGVLNPVPIRKKWEEHLSGTRNWQYVLWDVLMFQAWLAETKINA